MRKRWGLRPKAPRGGTAGRAVEMGDPRVSLVNRMFGVDARNRLWVGDITHLGLRGWLYLAAVIDAWHRKVVGWSMSSSASPAHGGCARAIGRRIPAGYYLVFHDDQGVSTRPAHLAAAGPWDDSPIDVEARPWDNLSAEFLLQDPEAGAGEREGSTRQETKA